MHGDAGAVVRCQNVAAATATQEAPHCVHTLVVTRAVAWVLTLINVQAVRGFVAAVSFSVKAISRVTRAHDSSEVVSALLLAGRCSTHVHAFRDALAHHKPEPFTAFPPEASAVLPSCSDTGILHRQDLALWTLRSRRVHCERRPDRAGTGLPQERHTDCAKR